jgi:hypothetical protein
MIREYNFTDAQDWIEYIDLEDVRKKNITIPYLIPILKSFGFLPIVRDFEDNNQYNIVYVNSMLLGDVNIGIQIKNWIHGYFSQIGLETDTLENSEIIIGALKV